MMKEDENRIVVGIGDFKIGKAPGVIKTTLGSCIAVCLYDQEKKIGGMLHCMLPDSKAIKHKGDYKRAKFADTGLDDLVAALLKEFSITSSKLTAKIFGGAKMLKMVTQEIGKKNEEAVRSKLKSMNINIIADNVGGEKGYQIDFFLENGKVACRKFGETPEEF